MTDYLTLADVLAMHQDQVERYGGAHGLRDPGLLEAALFRPQTGYYADLIEEAAALWESMAQNHPFVDGNKRTAFAAMYTFLAINGANLNAEADETFRFISGLYETGTFRFEELVVWLRAHVAQP
ncbi:type II toxin-antitoxin system death-on-curing family toxin [Sphingosinicella soli]|uniref:Death-on-curing protein n=1 Tax=Sphingosinicella soli TaxID=333708 RepID=A0A7W7F6B0_9SPHN|nr:death-on-curing protein [Sphingosinicella soli]